MAKIDQKVEIFGLFKLFKQNEVWFLGLKVPGAFFWSRWWRAKTEQKRKKERLYALKFIERNEEEKENTQILDKKSCIIRKEAIIS